GVPLLAERLRRRGAWLGPRAVAALRRPLLPLRERADAARLSLLPGSPVAGRPAGRARLLRWSARDSIPVRRPPRPLGPRHPASGAPARPLPVLRGRQPRAPADGACLAHPHAARHLLPGATVLLRFHLRGLDAPRVGVVGARRRRAGGPRARGWHHPHPAPSP